MSPPLPFIRLHELTLETFAFIPIIQGRNFRGDCVLNIARGLARSGVTTFQTLDFTITQPKGSAGPLYEDCPRSVSEELDTRDE